jgi:hypothetical protein
VPYLGLHAARHGAVKLLRAAGISDGVIARRMGHDENVMRVVYGAPRTVEQDPAAAVMDRVCENPVRMATGPRVEFGGFSTSDLRCHS